MPGLALFLTQIAVILLVARAVGWILRRVHQPQVIGEMVAGLLLGPSVFGLLFPGPAEALFPEESLGFLSAVSQLGIVLFMFLMGLDIDPGMLRGKAGKGRAAMVTSQVGMVMPFVLGVLLGVFLYPRLSPPGVHPAHFAVFMGTAMSITAFPVLARILSERGLKGTSLGTMALACAATDDVAGWSLLATVVLLTRSQAVSSSVALTLLVLLLLGLVLWFLVRPLLRKIVGVYLSRGFLSNDLLALVLLLVLFSAVATELAGVHALFGAFLLGVLVPRRSDFARALAMKMEELTVVLFLPIFFALTGLRTRIGLLTGAEMWGYCALVVVVAIAGKFGGVTAAARFTGLTWREAGALGALMNTRGLVELIVLNIGLDVGILSPSLFTMMVIMALLTTIMTTPVLQGIYGRLPSETPASKPA